MQSIKYWLLLIAALLLNACSTLPNTNQEATPSPLYAQHLAKLQSIDRFMLKGRIGVQTDKRGFSGSTLWTHAISKDEISLFSPLGSQVASIAADNTGVSLVSSDGSAYHESSAELLTQKALGWSLPMKGLSDWVLGRPTSSTINNITWDEAGRIKTLSQDGWQIEYDQYSSVENTDLPGKIFLKSQQLNLKFVVESWSLQKPDTPN